MSRILLALSRWLWWPFFVFQWVSFLASIYFYIIDYSLVLCAAFFFGAFGFYLMRVVFKGLNREHFRNIYEVTPEAAPGAGKNQRRHQRRKNKRDQELNDIADGIL